MPRGRGTGRKKPFAKSKPREATALGSHCSASPISSLTEAGHLSYTLKPPLLPGELNVRANLVRKELSLPWVTCALHILFISSIENGFGEKITQL